MDMIIYLMVRYVGLRLLISFVAYDNNTESMKWNARLGHIDKEKMARLAREGLLVSLAMLAWGFLPSRASKACRKPYT